MTQAMDRQQHTDAGIAADHAFAAAAARIAREIELYCRLEAVADAAAEIWGATHLSVETIDGGADVLAIFGDEESVIDLWDLDPLLWDEANRAAMEFFPVGQTGVIHPRRA